MFDINSPKGRFVVPAMVVIIAAFLGKDFLSTLGQIAMILTPAS